VNAAEMVRRQCPPRARLADFFSILLERKKEAAMVLLEFSMSPLGKGESVGKYVARSLDIIDKSGVPYRLNPMGTVLEGEWEDVFGVVQQCYERMKKDCRRISCTIKVDYRKGPAGRLDSKVASVEKKLKRAIKH
jgi:uncharacterized protein (TIGR00106 family)